MSLFIKLLGTFGFTGFFPIAPATFASFVFCLIYLLAPGGEVLANPIVAAVTLVLSIPVSTYLEKQYGHDSGRIVIDEVVGLQVALVFARPTTAAVVVAFFLFRFYDIVKPFPIRGSQNLPAGWGVVCDDFLAGIYTRVTLVIIGAVVPGMGNLV